MKHFIVFLVAGLMGCAFLAAGAQAGTRGEKPNSVGAELLGRGILVTLNYERYINDHFGGGVGFMGARADGGSIAILPLYVSFLSGERHSLYLGAGVTYFGGGGTISDYETESFTTFSVGYQFQAESGFFIRPLISFLGLRDMDTGNSSLTWPGLAMGATF